MTNANCMIVRHGGTCGTCSPKRGYRFLARVGQTLVYHTDSVKGMRDQCVRLLEHKYKSDAIEVWDELTGSVVRTVDAQTIWEWRI